MERTAAFLGVSRSIEDAVSRVRKAEELSYEGAWVTQTSGRDALGVLAAYAQATSRIRFGTGVIPIYGRAPAVLAQGAATLAETSNGRFTLGIGVSHKPAVEAFFGQPYERPLRDMREYLRIVTDILRTGRTSQTGERFSATFGLTSWTPPRVPVYISALSPRMCRLAGEMADGVVLWCCTPDYIRDWILPCVAEGAASAGRDAADIDVVAAIPACATSDPDAARDALRRDLFIYWTLPNYRAAIIRAGYGAGIEAFDDALRSGGPDAARAAIPDAFCDALGAFGAPDTIREKVDEYRTKGASLPAVGPFRGHDAALGTTATLEAAAPAR